MPESPRDRHERQMRERRAAYVAERERQAKKKPESRRAAIEGETVHESPSGSGRRRER